MEWIRLHRGQPEELGEPRPHPRQGYGSTTFVVTRPICRRSCGSTFLVSVTSPASTPCTSSATSAPTPCRWPASAHNDRSRLLARPRWPSPEQLASDCGRRLEFVHPRSYHAVDGTRPRRFDLVYTGIGALCWLPDVRGWADVVSDLLRPGGRLFIREGHPMLWSLSDPRLTSCSSSSSPTSRRRPAPSSPKRPPTSNTMASWPRPIDHLNGTTASPRSHVDRRRPGCDVATSTSTVSVPWNPLGAAMEALPNGEYQLRERPSGWRPTYTLQAVKS